MSTVLSGVKLWVKNLNFLRVKVTRTAGMETRGEAELKLRGFHALPAPEIYTTKYFEQDKFLIKIAESEQLNTCLSQRELPLIRPNKDQIATCRNPTAQRVLIVPLPSGVLFPRIYFGTSRV